MSLLPGAAASPHTVHGAAVQVTRLNLFDRYAYVALSSKISKTKFDIPPAVAPLPAPALPIERKLKSK